MGANGGAALAYQAGREVDVLLTTAFLFRSDATRQEVQTRESLRGLRVESVWVDEKCGTAAQVARELRQLGVGYKRIRGVPSHNRNAITWEVITELTFPWVSTGVWAACLALASGASSVELVGVSLDGGHSGMEWDRAPRYHANEDAACLRALLAKGVRVPDAVLRAVV
jgi:hypothetical protein